MQFDVIQCGPMLIYSYTQHCRLNDVTGIHTAGPRPLHFTYVSYLLNFMESIFFSVCQLTAESLNTASALPALSPLSEQRYTHKVETV